MENDVPNIKTRSIRADNESFEKFKVIAEEFPNQAQALSALISSYEIEKSKSLIPERQSEIENFSSHIQKLNELYNHSLRMNQDAELRVRVEFERQLTSKDTAIQDLQKKVKELENAEKSAKEEKITLAQENTTNKKHIFDLEREIITYKEEKSKSDALIKNLTEITTEYKEQAKENETLKLTIIDLEQKNKYLTVQEKEKEKSTSFLIQRLNLEKEQALLELDKKYNQTINKLNEEHQKKTEELLTKIEKKSISTTRAKKATDTKRS